MSATRKEVFSGLGNAKVPADIFPWIKAAENQGAKPEIDKDVLFRIKSFGLERLSELTAEDIDAARKLILGEALDLCIADEPSDEGRHFYSEYRRILLKWIESYLTNLPNEMRTLRGEVLEEVVCRLKKEPHVDLVWIIAVIGYRDDEVCAVLREMAESDLAKPSTRDAALSTLCSLGGLTDNEKDQYRVLAERRLEVDGSIPLFNVLRWISSPKSIGFLLKSLDGYTVKGQRFYTDLSLAALSEIAESSPETADKIWAGIIAATESDGKAEGRVNIGKLIFNSGTLKRIDVEAEPPDLLRALAGDTGQDRNHFRYIIYKRLSELTGQNQLKGLSVAPNEAVVAQIKSDCVRNTSNTSRNMTHEDWLKESAWETAIRIGIPEALEWTEGVFSEDSQYMRGRIIKLLSCFSLPELPDTIGEWLRKRVNWDGGDTPEMFYVEPAIRLAGHSSDPRVFEWLLDLGMTYRGQVPTSAADALAAHCVEQISASEDTENAIMFFVANLLAAFDPEWKGKKDTVRQRRMLASAALEAINSQFPLVDEETYGIRNLFSELDTEDDLYALCPLMGIAADSDPTEDELKLFCSLAVHENSWVAGYGVSALVRANALHQAPEVLSKYEISLNEDSLGVTEPSGSSLGGYLLAHQYLDGVGNLAEEVANALEKADWRTASQILFVLFRTDNATLRRDERIQQALLSRIINNMSQNYSETNLFSYLARLAPEMFLDTEWHEYWDKWSTEARIALIGAIHEVGVDASFEDIAKTIDALGRLERDPVREVRQEARLAWATIFPDSLDAIVEGRADPDRSSETDMRMAADALWAVSDDEKFKNAANVLGNARERKVREACRESIKTRRERQNANYHLRFILGAKADTESMLGAWKHGSALIEVGQEDHLDKLRKHLSSGELRSNQRHWLKIVIEKLEKKIKEKKRKEAPDWSPPGAQTIRGPGVIKVDGKEKEATFLIRQWESETLDGKVKWEGDAWYFDPGSTPSAYEAEISLQNGLHGRIFISSTQKHFLSEGPMISISFSGSNWGGLE